MRLDVPYFMQDEGLDCGPTALRMVLAYFGRKEDMNSVQERAGKKEGKGISTIQIATAAASLGYKTDFYSKHILFNEEHMKHDFYQKYADVNLVEQSKILVAKASQSGVNIHEKTLILEEILKNVTRNSIPIVLLDWNIVNGKKGEGYKGHFVPIVGYDDEKVYVHDSGKKNTVHPKQFRGIDRGIFDEARKADGTDEDIVIIYRN